MFETKLGRRSQEDVLRVADSRSADQFSLLTGISCPASEDQARQEFKGETDVETVLRRHGGLPPAPVGAFGMEVDFDVPLQSALGMLEEASQAWQQAPLELRKRYPTYAQFVSAVERGEVRYRKATPKPAAEAAEAPAAGNAGAASEPAAGSEGPGKGTK